MSGTEKYLFYDAISMKGLDKKMCRQKADQWFPRPRKGSENRLDRGTSELSAAIQVF